MIIIGLSLVPDFNMLILVCIGVGFVILIAICVALIIIKYRNRDHGPPSATMLLDTEYRKSINEPLPYMADDSGHYRSLIKMHNNADYPVHNPSQTLPRQGHFQPGPSAPYNPDMDADGDRKFLTMQHGRATLNIQPSTGARDSQKEGTNEYNAPNYFVLDQNFIK